MVDKIADFVAQVIANKSEVRTLNPLKKLYFQYTYL